MELAGFHLFKRGDLDSAVYYYRFISKLDTINEIWGRAAVSLAYIAGNRNETEVRDSIYQVVLEKMPEGDFTRYAAKALGIPIENEQTDSLYQRYMNAEDLWWDADDPITARKEYIAIADIADSSSDIRMKALLAAAYLSRKVINDDTLALSLYAAIADEFEETEAGRLAGRRTDTRSIDGGEDEMVKGNEEFEDGISEFGEIDRSTISAGFTMDGELIEVDDRIYEPDELDELPLLMTNPKKLQRYVSRYYPDEVRGENIKSRVEIEFIIQPSSEISDVRITFTEMPGRGFEEAAQDVMNRLNYSAGKRMGKKVQTRMKQVLVFEDEDQSGTGKSVKPEVKIKGEVD